MKNKLLWLEFHNIFKFIYMFYNTKSDIFIKFGTCNYLTQIFTIRNIFILHLYIIIINKSAKWHCGHDTSINKM